MADNMTTTRAEDPPAPRRSRTVRKPLAEQINDKLNEVKELLVESGVDEGTADARLFSARPDQIGGSLVGNFADLQRAGGRIASGEALDFSEGVVVPTTVDEKGNVTLTEQR